jgi:hypothetical protein
MSLGSLVDPIAGRLLELQKVSGTQWFLRVVGAAAMTLALLVTVPEGPASGLVATVLALAVAVGLLVQFVRPDSDLGLLAPAAILLALAGQGDLTVLRAAGTGLALLLSHAAFALVATLPAHGVFGRTAWLLSGKGLLAVLGTSVIGGLVVLALGGISFGPWMLVVGLLAVIVLFVGLMPRPR